MQPLPFFAAFAWSGQGEHWLIAALAMGLKWLLDSLSYLRLERDGRGLTILLLPLKDLLAPCIWLVAAFRTRVSWRGHPLRLGRGSQLVPVERRSFDVLFDRV